jgi:hypothetical protein
MVFMTTATRAKPALKKAPAQKKKRSNNALAQRPIATAEAVIISGHRKGEIVHLDDNGERRLTAEEEAALALCVQAAQQFADTAKSANASAQRLLQELRDLNRRAT